MKMKLIQASVIHKFQFRPVLRFTYRRGARRWVGLLTTVVLSLSILGRIAIPQAPCLLIYLLIGFYIMIHAAV